MWTNFLFCNQLKLWKHNLLREYEFATQHSHEIIETSKKSLRENVPMLIRKIWKVENNKLSREYENKKVGDKMIFVVIHHISVTKRPEKACALYLCNYITEYNVRVIFLLFHTMMLLKVDGVEVRRAKFNLETLRQVCKFNKGARITTRLTTRWD